MSLFDPNGKNPFNKGQQPNVAPQNAPTPQMPSVPTPQSFPTPQAAPMPISAPQNTMPPNTPQMPNVSAPQNNAFPSGNLSMSDPRTRELLHGGPGMAQMFSHGNPFSQMRNFQGGFPSNMSSFMQPQQNQMMARLLQGGAFQ